MAVAVALLLLASALAPAAWGCAVPHGGCASNQCAKYAKVAPGCVALSNKNYALPETWLLGCLPQIGYYVGLYNKAVNGGVYNKSGVPGTPALNYEKFDLENTVINPKTGKPYAIPSPETTIMDCCNKCAKTDDCNLFQFFYGTPQGGSYCYLLSGGTSDFADYPEFGVPFSGTHSDQTKSTGIQYNKPLSFIGGRCNGSPGVKADPHFTGAKGVQYDFNGNIGKSYCIMADKQVQVNALLNGYYDNRTEGASAVGDGKALRTWMREVALLWKDESGKPHSLHLVARSGKQQERGSGFLKSASIDGRSLELPTREGQGIVEGDLASHMSFKYLGVRKQGRQDVDQFQVLVKGVMDLVITLRVAHQNMQTPDDAQAHFNLRFNYLKTTPNVHGVLGQTYRDSEVQIAKAVKYLELNRVLGGHFQADGEAGKGFLEGEPAHYVTSGITKPDCIYSPF